MIPAHECPAVMNRPKNSIHAPASHAVANDACWARMRGSHTRNAKAMSTGSPHRDSEKEEGMFGTLVVLLPSLYAGGELVVEHAGERRTIDVSAGEGWREF